MSLRTPDAIGRLPTMYSAGAGETAVRQEKMKMKLLWLTILILAAGCWKPIDFSNNRAAEFASAKAITPGVLRQRGFRVESLQLPANATNIRLCEESGIDMTLWWSFDVSEPDLSSYLPIATGTDPCPFRPQKHDESFWMPADRKVLGVHSKTNMTWVGVDQLSKRVYCLKYTM